MTSGAPGRWIFVLGTVFCKDDILPGSYSENVCLSVMRQAVDGPAVRVCPNPDFSLSKGISNRIEMRRWFFGPYWWTINLKSMDITTLEPTKEKTFNPGVPDQ